MQSWKGVVPPPNSQTHVVVLHDLLLTTQSSCVQPTPVMAPPAEPRAGLMATGVGASSPVAHSGLAQGQWFFPPRGAPCHSLKTLSALTEGPGDRCLRVRSTSLWSSLQFVAYLKDPKGGRNTGGRSFPALPFDTFSDPSKWTLAMHALWRYVDMRNHHSLYSLQSMSDI